MAKKEQVQEVAADGDGVDLAAQANAAAVANLDALESEEAQAAQADAAVVEDVTTEEGKKISARMASEAKRRAAEAGAAMAVGFMETMVKARAPYVDIGSDSRDHLVNALAPVLEKHQTGMPEWLVPYKEEFSFCMALGGVAFGVYLQVQAHEAQERAKREQAKRDQAA